MYYIYKYRLLLSRLPNFYKETAMMREEHNLIQFRSDGIMPLQDRHKPEVRKHLSAPALRSFFNISDEWSLTVPEQCALLGHIAKSTYHKWKSGNIGTLSYDQLERLSLILGLYKGLKLLFVDDVTQIQWLRASNDNHVFAGKSPLEKMLDGGIEDFYQVRRYIDAWRGGE